MDQPQNTNPPRAARPQLFSAPASKPSNGRARGHADFGPSILATIDGGQSRIASSRDRPALKRVLMLSVLALLAAGAYVGMKFSAARAAAEAPVMAVAPAVMPVGEKRVELVAAAAAQVDAQGAAAIETVVAAAPLAAASAPAPQQVASIGNIQQTLERSEPVATRQDKPVSKSGQPTRTSASTASSTKPAPKKAKSQADTDADLLAAMLPHIARSTGAGSSAAFERRCGQLSGEAAANCKTKFCNGREGADAACPAPASDQ
jgi:hypothetical protein